MNRVPRKIPFQEFQAFTIILPVAKPEPPAEEEQVAESTTENIFSTDSSSEDDVLRGVSNVVYRKEYGCLNLERILALFRTCILLPPSSSELAPPALFES